MKERNTNLIESLIFPLILIAIMWVVKLTEYLFELNFAGLGICPRTGFGLRGVLFAPFIHADFQHLISNSIPFLASGMLLLQFFKRVAFPAFAWMYLGSGLLTWLVARNVNEAGGLVYHIGASGVVYALVAFIFFSGLFIRNRVTITLSLVMIISYSGMIQGLSPHQTGVSWEGHLMGGLMGLLVALAYRNTVKAQLEEATWSHPEIPEEAPEPFLPRDAFERTRWEREQDNSLPSAGEH